MGAKTTDPRVAGQTYLLGRGIDIGELDLDHVLGFDSRCARDARVDDGSDHRRTSGIHRTFLDQEARKIERKMLGKQGVIRISPDEDVVASLSICEGVEDALSVLLSGWRPIWAATSAGRSRGFPYSTGSSI